MNMFTSCFHHAVVVHQCSPFHLLFGLVPEFSPSAYKGSSMAPPVCVNVAWQHACSGLCSPHPTATQTPLLISGQKDRVNIRCRDLERSIGGVGHQCHPLGMHLVVVTCTRGASGSGLSICATDSCLCKEARWNAVYPSKSLACVLAPFCNRCLC